MNRRKTLSFGLLLTTALLLTLLKVPVASSQGVTLVAAQVAGDLPVNDPNAEMWQEAIVLQVPLSAQTVTKPILR
jgi:hypothetical protein